MSSNKSILFFPAKGRPRSVRGAKRKGGYEYPRSMLEQDYFTKCGNGMRLYPSLGPRMLLDENFESPLQHLLERLTSEGNDVSACMAEFHAMRRAMEFYQEKIDAVRKVVRSVDEYHCILDPKSSAGPIVRGES